jgi:membrane-associated phospholipid phosphatase
MLVRRRTWYGARLSRPKLPRYTALLEMAAVALALSGFVLLGRLYNSPSIEALDNAGLQLTSGIRSPDLDRVASFVTSLGAEWLWLVWVPVAGLLIAQRKLPSAAALVVVALGVQPWNDLLKAVYHRARPTEFGSGVQAFSFPSGHAMAAGAVFGILAVLAWRELSGAARWVAVAICIGVAVLIALTRPYLGVHYPSDVIAGLLAGGLWADLVLLVWRASAYRFGGKLAHSPLVDDTA